MKDFIGLETLHGQSNLQRVGKWEKRSDERNISLINVAIYFMEYWVID